MTVQGEAVAPQGRDVVEVGVANRPHASPPSDGQRHRERTGGLFASLRHRDYRLFWIATLVMSMGQWVQQVTIGWLLYDVTSSAILLGAMYGLRSLPFLLISPIAGVAADRFDRRLLLMSTMPIMVLLCVLMGLVLFFDMLAVWHIFLFTAFTAIVWAFNNPVRQTLVPNLVPRRDLLNAIALNSAGFNSQKIVGPAIGGLLIAAIGATGNFFLQAATCAGVFLLLWQMRVPPTPSGARRASAAANLREGFSYVLRDPLLAALLLAALAPPLFSLPITMALLPVFQKDVYQAGPDALGALMAGPGIGAIIATLGLAWVGHRLRRHGLVLLIDLALLGAATIVFSQAPSLPLAILALVGVGIFQMGFFTISHTLLQTIVPDELRGRVNSIFMADHGLAPAGALVAGVSTQTLGPQTTVAIFGGALMLAAAVIAFRAPRLWSTTAS